MKIWDATAAASPALVGRPRGLRAWLGFPVLVVLLVLVVFPAYLVRVFGRELHRAAKAIALLWWALVMGVRATVGDYVRTRSDDVVIGDGDCWFDGCERGVACDQHAVAVPPPLEPGAVSMVCHHCEVHLSISDRWDIPALLDASGWKRRGVMLDEFCSMWLCARCVELVGDKYPAADEG